MDSLFKTIITTSIFASFVGIAIIALKAILRNKLSPKWHYLIWIVLILKLLMPVGPKSPVSFFNAIPDVPQNINIEEPFYQASQQNNAAIENNTATLSNNTVTDSLPSMKTEVNDKSTVPSKVNPLPYIWATGTVLMLLWLTFTYYSLYKKMCRGSEVIEPRIQNIFEDCKIRMGIKRKIKLVSQNVIGTPSLFGVIKMRIFLTPSVENLSDKELEYILLHELAHFKRKDILTSYLLLAIQSIHWFNPVMWYCFRRIRQDMEVAADERALTYVDQTEHKCYGEALLTVLESFSSPRLVPKLIGMADGTKNIKNRLQMIKMVDLFKKRRKLTLIIGVLCLLILGGFFLTTAVSSKPADTVANMPITSEATANGVSLKLLVSPEKYSPLMSSTPGIRIQAEYSSSAAKVRYSTGNGYLLTWDSSTGEVSEKEKTVELPYGSPVYWSPIYKNKDIYTGINDTLTVEVFDSKGNKIAEQKVDISNDGSTNYSVKHSSNVFIELGTTEDNQKPQTVEDAVSIALKAQGKSYLNAECFTEGHVILDTEEKDGLIKVYTIASVGWFGFENGIFTKTSGSGAIPTVITLSKDENGGFSINEVKEPKDGSYYLSSIKEMFPTKLQNRVLSSQDNPELAKQQEEQAAEYLKNIGRKASVSLDYVKKQRVNIPVEASNELFAVLTKYDDFLNTCPDWIGTRERIENGVRYIYETSQSKSSDGYDLVTFKKTTENGSTIEKRIYKIVGTEPQLITPQGPGLTSKIDKVSEADKESALKVVTSYFSAFAKKDYKTMESLSTSKHNKTYVHSDSVFGMEWAKARKINFDGSEMHDMLRFGVSVEMKTAKISSLYPETETFFFVLLAKGSDGIWRVDGYTTG